MTSAVSQVDITELTLLTALLTNKQTGDIQVTSGRLNIMSFFRAPTGNMKGS